jgi:hypothetical protein
MNARERLERLQSKQRDNYEKSIAREIESRPDLDYVQIGKRFGLSAARISHMAVKYGVRRKRGPKSSTESR